MLETSIQVNDIEIVCSNEGGKPCASIFFLKADTAARTEHVGQAEQAEQLEHRQETPQARKVERAGYRAGYIDLETEEVVAEGSHTPQGLRIMLLMSGISIGDIVRRLCPEQA